MIIYLDDSLPIIQQRVEWDKYKDGADFVLE
jgi:hypothetical protein